MALQNVDELRAGRPGEVLRIIIDPEMTRESLVALPGSVPGIDMMLCVYLIIRLCIVCVLRCDVRCI